MDHPSSGHELYTGEESRKKKKKNSIMDYRMGAMYLDLSLSLPIILTFCCKSSSNLQGPVVQVPLLPLTPQEQAATFLRSLYFLPSLFCFLIFHLLSSFLFSHATILKHQHLNGNNVPSFLSINTNNAFRLAFTPVFLNYSC